MARHREFDDRLIKIECLLQNEDRTEASWEAARLIHDAYDESISHYQRRAFDLREEALFRFDNRFPRTGEDGGGRVNRPFSEPRKTLGFE